MLKIRVDDISPRLSYTFDFIFTERGVEYIFVTDDTSSVDFEYTEGFSKLLYDTSIKDQVLKRDSWKGVECLSFEGIADPFASIFYVLTRYEEYLNKEKDQYDRFPFDRSILGKDWVMKAMCDRWASAILNELNLEGETGYQGLQPSFDIDNAFAYKHKEGSRKFLSTSKDIVTGNSKRLKERKAVTNGEKDPYDTFDRIIEISKQFPLTRVFWLCGKWAKKDRNLSIQHPEHQKLIQSVSENVEVGLHPSFASFLEDSVIISEKNDLEGVLSKTIESSRQHFLRFQLPETFQQLQAIGFKHEHTMGFAEHVGFRCGTARPHFWFDLSKNEGTDLCIHPFVYMDGTLREYMGLTINQCKEIISELHAEVREYGGVFSFIWHNETIGDYGLWEGWSAVLDYTLNLDHE